MIVLAVCMVLAIALAFVWLVMECRHQFERDRETGDKRWDVTSEALGGLADRVAKLEEKLEELPVAEMEEEYKRLSLFNDGVQNIMNFGPDVPKLSKEGLRSKE